MQIIVIATIGLVWLALLMALFFIPKAMMKQLGKLTRALLSLIFGISLFLVLGPLVAVNAFFPFQGTLIYPVAFLIGAIPAGTTGIMVSMLLCGVFWSDHKLRIYPTMLFVIALGAFAGGVCGYLAILMTGGIPGFKEGFCFGVAPGAVCGALHARWLQVQLFSSHSASADRIGIATRVSKCNVSRREPGG